jgi:type IV secretory pathway TrbL component
MLNSLLAFTLDTGTVTAIGAAVVVVVGAVVAGVISIITAVHATRTKVENVVTANVKSDLKLDRIEVLVDGRYSEVLQELADVKKLLAQATGVEADIGRAGQAQGAADRQEARVRQAGGRSSAPAQPAAEPTAEPAAEKPTNGRALLPKQQEDIIAELEAKLAALKEKD